MRGLDHRGVVGQPQVVVGAQVDDFDGWCDDPNAGQDPNGECVDADFDGWCDDPNAGADGGGDCADADGDGWCDDGSDEGEWF